MQQVSGVGISANHIAWLHSFHLQLGFFAYGLLHGVDEVHQWNGVGMPDVVHFVGNFLGGWMLQQGDDSLHDVINIGEVSLHFPMVEHMDGLAFEDGAQEEERSHVGSSPGSIHREETKSCGRYAIQLAIGISHQLVALFSGGIEAHRTVGPVVLAVGNFVAHAIDAARTGIQEVLHGMMAAVLQDVEKTKYVTLHVGVRIFYGVAYTSLPSEIHHGIEMLGVEQVPYLDAVGELHLVETKRCRVDALHGFVLVYGIILNS